MLHDLKPHDEDDDCLKLDGAMDLLKCAGLQLGWYFKFIIEF
jgi:hypothetical protein